jgi:hypothetical protein
MKTSTRITASLAAVAIAVTTLISGGAANAATSTATTDAYMKFALYVAAENADNVNLSGTKGTFKNTGVYGGTTVTWQRDGYNYCYIATPGAGAKGSQAKWITAVVSPNGPGDYKWSITKRGITTCAAAYADASITPGMAVENEVFGLSVVLANLAGGPGLTPTGVAAEGRYNVSGNFIQRMNANQSKNVTDTEGVNPNGVVWLIVNSDYTNAGKGATITLNSKNQIIVKFAGGQSPAKQPTPKLVGLNHKITVTGSVAPGTSKHYCLIVGYGHQYTKWNQDGKIPTPVNFVPSCVNGN